MRELIVSLLVIFAINAVVGCAEGDSSIEVKEQPPVVIEPPTEQCADQAIQYERCMNVCHLQRHKEAICKMIVYGN